jgi:hypothetical protein
LLFEVDVPPGDSFKLMGLFDKKPHVSMGLIVQRE